MALYSSPALAQAESHNFITYDTTISIFTPPWGPTNTWLVRISRPAGMFTPGSPDTASRPVIITMPGEGEQGNSDTSNLTVYGPHYWLKNGWDGSVVLGNGKHYPILITICYVNEVYTNVPDVYNVIDTLLTHYHIKRNAVHFAGLSEGAFTWGSLVAYETTPGAQTGMKIMTSMVALEGTPNPSLVNPNNTLAVDTPLYKTWATQYHGKYFYLEGSGSDNFRNGWQYSTAMNDAVPGSAYFSYESDGGGAHCCWNDMYNPAVTNWTCVGTLGTYNAPSEAGTNTMGDYKAPSSIFQWMLRQGDTTLVGTGTTTPVPPTVSAGPTQSVTLPVSTVTLTGTAVANAGATISSTAWTQTSGPSTATIASPSALSTSVTGLVAGTYTFQLKATDNNNESTESVDTVHVLAIAPAVTMGADPTIVLPQDSTTLTATDGTNGGPAITSTLWTEVSGPNTATIVTPTALTTSIKNMVAGTYSFQLTVTNTAGLTAAASVGITVQPAATTSSSPASTQAESHNFITYDTTISIFTPPWGPTNTWLVRISRPANMFTAGNADTASRPVIITMPGEGQQGNSDTSNLTAYGPHYWLNNGWDGSVVLGNGKHYPILITICYVNEVYTNVPDVYNVVDTLLTHYHIKRDAVHFAGLSEGAFTWGSLVAYETTPGAQTGMKIMTSLVALEGTPNPSLTQPNNTLGADTPLYKIWAAKYNGKYFYLEGTTDNFRNGWQYSTAMNDSVPGSAYFSYESDGGGAHCCWNDMYNPAVTNWTCVGTLGTYNAPSEAGTNTMGDYKAPSSIFQWMLRQGDTTLVGTGTTTPVPPTVSAGPTQSVTLPVSTVTLTGTAVANAGATISSTAWTQTSGPSTATIASPSALSTSVTGLVAGTYTFQLKATDNNNESTESVDTVHVLAIAPAVTMGADPTIVLPQDSTTLTATDGTNGGPAITSTLWTEVSGPNTATIVTPTALTTSIKNMVAGTYSFQLTVTNTAGLTAAASVGITVQPAPSDNTSIPGTITASNYVNSLSVATQPTTDVGGGLNVGWISPGDWMEYNVNVATAATYTVGFRLATPNTGCTLQLQTLSGTVLATVNIPVTGGWQTWQTITATATLPAGNQTLKVVSTGTGMWNINWMNFEYTTTTTQATGTADLSTAALLVNPVDSMSSGVNLYPNPGANNVTLTVNNSHTGNMAVQVIDLSGSIKKTYSLSKEGQYTDLSLYIGDLPSGVYFVRMQIGNWKTIQKLLKL